jgi:hypothetical protein
MVPIRMVGMMRMWSLHGWEQAYAGFWRRVTGSAQRMMCGHVCKANGVILGLVPRISVDGVGGNVGVPTVSQPEFSGCASLTRE